ncbi:MAG: ATP-binding cassette domain-containing protein [Deltaproteobacteria bacterium]|nr:ATP-binding cassette domain-containing protein [Deltaproteobacteria bacterium]
MLYHLKNIVKRFDQRTVLDLETVGLEKGRVVALLGPNGAGKTTLLEILAFLSIPASGELRFKDEKVDFSSGKLIDLRRRVVLVDQQPILFTTTVFKNLEFPLKLRKTPKAKREKIVEGLLDLVGMGAFRHAKAHRLSGGETQRVAIARALACFPEVILLDEPTGSVDVENQIIIEGIMQDINRRKGISVIFTTHNMIQATRLADETLFLYQGRVGRSIYENIFSGAIEVEANGQPCCLLQNGLRLKVRSDKTGPVRISIDPGKVEIITGQSGLLEENTFKGTLIQVTDEHNLVRALVDVGMPMSVLIPKEVFTSLHVGMGERLWLRCPVEGIDIF